MSSVEGKTAEILKKRRQALVILIAIPAFFAVSVYFFKNYFDLLALFSPKCIFNRYFGLNCIFCGGTRCACCLLRGEFRKALYYNPYVIVCALGAAVSYIYLFIDVCRKKYRPIPYKHVMSTLWVWLFLSVGFLIIRNLSFYQLFFY